MTGTASKGSRIGSAFRWLRRPPLALALLALLLYLPPAAGVLQLSADAVEYLDVARRLAAGEGYRLGIKAFHIGSTDVVHDGLVERPPLYPLLVAALLWLGFPEQSAQVLNAALTAGCVALISLLGSRLFGPTVGFLSGLLTVFSPAVLTNMISPMAEASGLFFTLLAVWLLTRNLSRPSAPDYCLAGLALGLAALARPATLVLTGPLLAGILLAAPSRERLLRPVLCLATAMALLLAPMSLYNFVTRGSPSISGQTYLYTVFRDRDVTSHALFQERPPPIQFILTNWDYVIGAMAERLSDYTSLLFTDSGWLLFLLPAWPFVILALIRGRYARGAWPLLLLATGNFLFYGLTWASNQRRYQLLTLLLLLPFAVDGLRRMGLERVRLPVFHLSLLHATVIGITLVWSAVLTREYRGEFQYSRDYSPTRTYAGLVWTGPSEWVRDDDLAVVLDWIIENTDPHDVVASLHPWPLTFFSGRPSVRLPENLDAAGLKRMTSMYRIAYLLVDIQDPKQRGLQRALGGLTEQGIRPRSVGSYRIFDTRGTW